MANTSLGLEAVAQALACEAQAGPLWLKLYRRPDFAVMEDMLQRVESAHSEALVLTVDAPMHGARDRERHPGFELRADVHAVNLGGYKQALQLAPGKSRCSTA